MQKLEEYTPEEIVADKKLCVQFLNKNLRRVEVLNQVKELLAFPIDRVANIQRIAKLYEVNEEEIHMLLEEFREEFQPDLWINGTDDSYLFSRRAILRFGLVIDSEVAEEVRSQLLNIARNKY